MRSPKQKTEAALRLEGRVDGTDRNWSLIQTESDGSDQVLHADLGSPNQTFILHTLTHD